MTSHWQVEGSGSKSDNLSKTTLLSPKDTIIEVEAEPLPLEGIPPSECWNLERNHILKALSYRENSLDGRKKVLIGVPQEANADSLKEAP